VVFYEALFDASDEVDVEGGVDDANEAFGGRVPDIVDLGEAGAC
jgi:hypothetical protein